MTCVVFTVDGTGMVTVTAIHFTSVASCVEIVEIIKINKKGTSEQIKIAEHTRSFLDFILFIFLEGGGVG